MLAYVMGSVDEEPLARNEYLVTENRILRGQIRGPTWLTDPERISLASGAKRQGRKALEEVAQIREGRVPFENDPVRRSLACTWAAAISMAMEPSLLTVR